MEDGNKSVLSRQPETELIDAEQYFSDYSKLLEMTKILEKNPLDDLVLTDDDYFCYVLGINKEQVNILKKNTDVSLLDCKYEINPNHFKLSDNRKEFTSQLIVYNSNKNISTSLETVQKRFDVKNVYPYPFEYLRYDSVKFYEPKETKRKVFPDLQPGVDILYTIKVYAPFCSNSTHFKIKINQEIKVLGQQTLADLKDAIKCPLDYCSLQDVSNNIKEPSTSLESYNKKISSFIFIEDTFYNDRRHKDLRSLSDVIIMWGHDRGLGPFLSKKMEKTKLCNVKLKIGRPYVYQHRGNCEHIILVSDIRLLSSSDLFSSQHYPFQSLASNLHIKKCYICGINFARWLVTENPRLTHEHSYLCHTCFVSYNYIDGVKVCNFKAYEYVDKVAVL